MEVGKVAHGDAHARRYCTSCRYAVMFMTMDYGALNYIPIMSASL